MQRWAHAGVFSFLLLASCGGSDNSSSASGSAECTVDSDCGPGESCKAGACVATHVAAGSTGSHTTSTGSGGSSGSAGTGGGNGTGGAEPTIPDPGSGDAFDNNVGSVEPNNTPAEATPLGTATGPNLYTWVNGNMIGGAGNDADYFVFRSGPMAGEFQLGSSGLCWGPPLTSLTATLWKVENQHQVMPPVHTWTVSTSSCLMSMPGDAPVEANTVYLLGIFGTGGVGGYGA